MDRKLAVQRPNTDRCSPRDDGGAWRLKPKLQTSESRINFEPQGEDRSSLSLLMKSVNPMVIVKSFRNLSLILSPGMVMGVLGANGMGKSTLLKAIQKSIDLDRGEVIHAHDLKIVYFDQNRSLLNPEDTLKEALSEVGGDTVIYQDQPVHIVTWAKRFQFNTEQLSQKLNSLSGGELARVMISRLMQQKADVLILDEPTNDLDIQTLELLETSLSEFPGCIIIVSHDRYMMQNLSDLCIGFLGDGKTGLFADYEQWENELKLSRSASTVRAEKKKENLERHPKNSKTELQRAKRVRSNGADYPRGRKSTRGVFAVQKTLSFNQMRP